MALSSLSGKIQTIFQWTAQKNLTGGPYNPVTNQGTIPKQQAYGTNVANAAAGGADEVFSFQQAITAGSSATIDLTAMTNLVLEASVSIVRIKGWQIRLLSAADDSTISPAPNASSTVTVTNNVTVPHPLGFRTGGSGLTLAITQSGGTINGVSIGAAGTLYPKSASFCVVPQQASGSGGVISVTTDSSGVPTSVAVVAGGTGYSNATVGSVVQGFFTLTTGNAQAYIDVTAAGQTVSSTQKNIKLLNNDPSNAVTVEIDVFGATT